MLPARTFLLLDINLPQGRTASGAAAAPRQRTMQRRSGDRDQFLGFASRQGPGGATGGGYFRKPPSYDEFLKLGGVLKQLLRENGAIE